jgi:regulator of replication initiation timing
MNRVGKVSGLLLPLGVLLVTLLVQPAVSVGQDPAEMKSELDSARKLNDELRARLAKLEAALAESQAVLANVQAQGERLKAENDQFKKELARLAERAASRREGATGAAGDTAPPTLQEREALRQQLRQLQADRDKNYKSVVELTDQLHNAFQEVTRLKAENARLSALLPPPPPKGLEGLVTARREDGFVEITLGSDDGMMPGHLMSVVRPKGTGIEVLGEIMVVKAAPDKAVCRVDSEAIKGAIQKGDRVTTGKQLAEPAATELPKPGEVPVLVGGTVLAVLPGGQVEISFGAGSGLRPGHRLEVYRETGGTGIYVGQIEVVQTGPKKSLCKIVSEMDTVREGDRVTSKL